MNHATQAPAAHSLATHGDTAQSSAVFPMGAGETLVVLDGETRCLMWRGGLDSKGYPREMVRGRRQQAHRAFWAAAHGLSDVRGVRLARACGRKLCAAPWHQIIQAPERIAETLGYDKHAMIYLRSQMRRWRDRGDWPVRWWGGLEVLDSDPDAMAAWAAGNDVPVLVALCVYASLVKKGRA